MIRVAVCDDEPIFVDSISKEVEAFFVSANAEFEIDKYTSGKEILSAITRKEYELILLDIRLGDVSGFDVAQEIYHITKGDNLIFVSCDEGLVCASLDFRPLGFIRKHKLEEETKRILGRWYEKYQLFRSASMQIKCQYGDVEVCLDDIMYIESKAHYVYVHTKSEIYRVRGKLTDFNYTLERVGFAKCSISYIINCKYIYRTDFKTVTLNNNTMISISRMCREGFKRKYMEYHFFTDI